MCWRKSHDVPVLQHARASGHGIGHALCMQKVLIKTTELKRDTLPKAEQNRRFRKAQVPGRSRCSRCFSDLQRPGTNKPERRTASAYTEMTKSKAPGQLASAKLPRPETSTHDRKSYPDASICKGTANKALAVVGEVKGAAWAVQELEGKGKPRKNPWAAWGAACRALDWHSYRQQRVWVP